MTPDTTYDVLVAGEINPDLILTGDVTPEFGQVEKLVDSATLTIGSSSAIFACGAERLGLKVAFIGVCGDDIFGRFMLDEMYRRGVDTNPVIVRSDRETGLSLILNNGSDRAILTHPGSIAQLQASDVTDDLLRQARHLHVASYFLQTKIQPDLPHLFRRAHALGLTTSLDPNYDPSEQWLGFDELLSVTDVFLLNQTEALSITRSTDIASASRQLATKAKLVAVKLGADGALACVNSPLASGQRLGLRAGRRSRVEAVGEIIRARSIPVSVADTVGAGDSFDAGLIYGYLKGWQIEKSLRLACVCGALSTQQAGGTNGQPTLNEALKFL